MLSEEQLEQALEAQRETSQYLGEVLIAHGSVTRPEVGEALAAERSLLVEREPGLGGQVHARAA